MHSLFPIILHIIFHRIHSVCATSALVAEPSCKSHCGALEIKYPFGTGHGCGSPHFHPYVSCSGDGNNFRLTTHTGSYVITSLSYDTSTITIVPPCMSSCTSMQSSPINFGLDWASPFQLGSSTFILLSCSSSTSSLTLKGNFICDISSAYLCESIYTCPGVLSLGLPLFPPTNSCCVYSPANLDPKDGLNLRELECAGYTSVISFGQVATDPYGWEYGVVLKYTVGGVENYKNSVSCHACQSSGGICGYAPPRNSFICVCEKGNTTTDCFSYKWIITSSSYQSIGKSWLGILTTIALFTVQKSYL